MLPQLLLRTMLASTLAFAGFSAMAAQPVADPLDDPEMLSAGFLAGHPDLDNRIKGQEALEEGRLEEALAYFRRASRYADKASQAMVGEMLWKGRGTAVNRPLAYAWMDLAAERGYRGFLQFRERYWEQLDDVERDRAVLAGQVVYDDYGDAVAQPRIARVLRRARRQVTGSRTGFVGTLKIITTGPAGESISIDGSKFHDERYWDPKQYAAWHDQIWMNPRKGRVNVGDTEVLPSRTDEPSSQAPSSAHD